MNNNSLAFIALCNEFCALVEKARELEMREFSGEMLRLLPRIYITAADLADTSDFDDAYIESILEEDSYDMVRRNLEMLFGEHDTYLEVFESDMKYSDTPIGASIAEGISDLFQVFYNFIETVRDSTDEVTASALASIKEDYQYFWGQTLCNVLRPIHTLYYNEND